MPNAVDKVGLGVDIIGGSTTLAELRAIRAEMEAIAGIAGRGGGGTGTTSSTTAAFNAQVDQQRKIEKLRATSAQTITDTEVRLTADAERRKQTVRQRAKELLLREEREIQDRITQQALLAEEKRQALIQRKRNQYSNTRSPSLARDLGDIPIRSRSTVALIKSEENLRRARRQQEFQESLQKESLNKRINARGEADQKRRLEQEERGYARLRQTLDQNTRRNRENIVREGQLREAQILKEAKLREAQAQAYADRRRKEATFLATYGGPVHRADPNTIQALQSQRRQAEINRRLNPALDWTRDTETQSFRDEQALRRRAERIQRDDRTRLAREREAALEAEMRRRDDIQTRWDKRRQDRFVRNYQAETARQQLEGPGLGTADLSQRLTSSTAATSRRIQNMRQTFDFSLEQDIARAGNQANRLGRRAADLRAELHSVNRTRPFQSIAADLRAVEKEQDDVLRKMKAIAAAERSLSPEARMGSRAGLGRRGGPGGPGGPPRGPRGGGFDPTQRLQDPQGLFNERGFFTSSEAAGRITRNILMYQAISLLTYGMGRYISESVAAAKATVEYGNALRFATEQAGGDIGANERLASSLQEVGLSRQQGRQAVTQAARFAISRPQDTEALTRTVANIAAARGLGIDKTDELIEQLRRRESKFYKRVFGTTVERVYENYAASQIDANTTPFNIQTKGLFIGEDKILSRDKQISRYVESMDDAQKETAIFNYILNRSSQFQGEAAERALTLAGRLDKVNAAFLNAKEAVGLFITDLKPVNDLLDLLVKAATQLDGLKSPALGRTGIGGTISNIDALQYAADSTTGFRAKALREADVIGTPIAAGLLGAGALGLFGRRQAQEHVRSAEYARLFEVYKKEFNGNLVAAQNEAIKVARNAKPGLVRSVGQGVSRLTMGVSDSMRGFLGMDPLMRGVTLPVFSNLSPQARQLSLGQNFAAPGSYGRVTAMTPVGSFSPLLQRNDLRDLNRIQSFSTMTGGIVGGVAGATLGAIVADKLNVGPITATGLTIAGGIAGTTIGTAIGQTIATSITSYIISKGGFASLLGVGGFSAAVSGAGGFGALMNAPLVGSGLLGAGLGLGVGVLGLGAGLGIGAGFNYLNEFDYMSQEQKTLEKQIAFEKIIAKQQKELAEARKEGLVYYRDLQPGSATFNKLFSEREAKQLSGFQFGFTGRHRRFSEETLLGTDPTLQLKTQEDIERRRLDLQGRLLSQYKNEVQVKEQLDRLRRKDTTTLTELEKIVVEEQTASLEEQLVVYEKLAKLKTDKQLLFDYGTLDPERIKFLDDFRTRMANKWKERQIKDQEEIAKAERKRTENITEMGNAIGKLRDAVRGSFRVVGDIAQSITGPENKFTEIIANQETALTRMQQQWGHLGDAVVDYFTRIEQKNLDRSLTKAEFGSYTTATNLISQADKERDALQDPSTLSRRDQEYLNIQSAIVDKATQIPQLWKQAAEVLGSQTTQQEQFIGRMNLIGKAFGVQMPAKLNALGQDITPRDNRRYNALGQDIGGYFDMPIRRNIFGESLEDPAIGRMFSQIGQGQNAEVARQLRQQFANTLLGAFEGLSPMDIRRSGYADVYVGAIRAQAGILDDNIQQEIRKADFAAREDVRLREQLAADARFREEQLAKGRDRATVLTESDKLLLARTDNIATKDLTADQFIARQEALQRQAETEVNQQAEARAAVKKGLEYQQQLIVVAAGIREAILSGSIQMVMQVQNDTQARLDAEALQTNSGKYQTPDQRNVKSSTYTPSTMKYRRTGGTYGLTNR